jgi:hypothetical protein
MLVYQQISSGLKELLDYSFTGALSFVVIGGLRGRGSWQAPIYGRI